MLRRHRVKVNFSIERNETDRLEKNGIDDDAATDGIERHEKKKKKKKREKRRELQFNIRLHKWTQTKHCSKQFFFFLRSSIERSKQNKFQ